MDMCLPNRTDFLIEILFHMYENSKKDSFRYGSIIRKLDTKEPVQMGIDESNREADPRQTEVKVYFFAGLYTDYFP